MNPHIIAYNKPFIILEKSAEFNHDIAAQCGVDAAR